MSGTVIAASAGSGAPARAGPTSAGPAPFDRSVTPIRPSVRWRASPARRVVVLSRDEGALARVHSAAGRDRVVSAGLVGEPGGITVVPAHDELVVDIALLPRLLEAAPDVLRNAPRVRLLRPGVADPFAEALPTSTRVAKRAIDMIVAGLALAVVLPLLAIAAIAVKVSSPGPALFVQERVGWHGRRFRSLKLRTMVAGKDDAHQAYVASLIRGEAPTNGGIYKLVDNPRITPVGRWLRRFSIDELPQLWNVLRCDLALVGPRAPLWREVEVYHPRAWRRLEVKPGLTGLWQVSGRSMLNFEQMLELDIEYASRCSVWMDLKLLARTPFAVLTARGAA